MLLSAFADYHIKITWNDIVHKENDEEGMLRAGVWLDEFIDAEISRGIPAQNIVVGQCAITRARWIVPHFWEAEVLIRS